jgi:tripartite-type tricarboxylate transporter receptor subunit TctC
MHMPSRRRFALHLAAFAATAALPATRAQAAVGRLVVGYPPGGTLDATARHLADALKRQGRSYIVDNKAGAQGRIANAQFKQEKPDGSAVLCTHTSAMTIYPHVYSKLAYNPAADFRPVTPVASVTCALAISSAVPSDVKTVADYVRWVKAHPEGATYASPAAGSMAHFLGFSLQQEAGFKLTHVAYRGSAPALQDLLGGQIPAYLGFVGDFLPYLEAGKLRILAVSSSQRSRFLPGVATFAEQGLPKVSGTDTYGLFLPPGTPEAEVTALAEAARRATQDGALIAGFAKSGLEPVSASPSDFARRMAAERDWWRPVVQASGFRSDD